MFIRALALLLLALNIGVGLWLYFVPSAPHNPSEPTDAGVPKLVLLSETERGAAAPIAEMASPPETAADLRRDICASIGPFATQADVRTALNALTPLVSRVQFREVQVNELLGWWVFLPAPPNREQALEVARQLSNKGVRDYYVVTAGDQSNTISLGVFRDAVNAEKRRSEIAALGFTAQVTQRSDNIPEYFIDYAQNGTQAPDWRAHLSGMDLRQQPVDCF